MSSAWRSKYAKVSFTLVTLFDSFFLVIFPSSGAKIRAMVAPAAAAATNANTKFLVDMLMGFDRVDADRGPSVSWSAK